MQCCLEHVIIENAIAVHFAIVSREYHRSGHVGIASHEADEKLLTGVEGVWA